MQFFRVIGSIPSKYVELFVNATIQSVLAGIILGYLLPALLSNESEQAALNARKIENKQEVLNDFSKSLSINLSLLSAMLNVRRDFCADVISQDVFEEKNEKYWMIIVQQSSLYADMDIVNLYFRSEEYKKIIGPYKDSIESVRMVTQEDCSRSDTWNGRLRAAKVVEGKILQSMIEEIQEDEDRKMSILIYENKKIKMYAALALFIALMIVMLIAGCSNRYGRSMDGPSNPKRISGNGTIR